MFVDYASEYAKASGKMKQYKTLTAYIIAIETEKLYYFALAMDQSHPVIIVKSPSDNKLQKEFLGYERSGSKGDEGIKLAKNASGHHLTPLYDETDRTNMHKINTIISANFNHASIQIPDTLADVVSSARLVDMLDRSRVTFDKQMSLTPKKTVTVESKWPMKSIEYFLQDIK
jgi:hypothetical protein